MNVRYDFAGRTVVVTGAGNGIGAACARLFAASGAGVALWDVDIDGARRLAGELQPDRGDATAGSERTESTVPPGTARRPRALAVRCDVASSVDVAAALAATLEAFGRVDVLVNNAGIARSAPFLEASEADWDAVLGVNLKGAFLVGQAVARAMAESGGGSIVNMSSVNGRTAIPEIAAYNASKGGIDQLTRAMALALTDAGVRVNAVAPGTIATELAQRAVLGSEAARARILSRTPLGRLGEPDEVAAVCAFLASDAASYITGEIVVVDGGRMALNYTVPAPAR